MCGSFCTHRESVEAMRRLIKSGAEIQPIMSEIAYSTDTRFHIACQLRREIEELCKRSIIHTIADAEPLGPKEPLEALIIAPCTGNTLAKLSHGIADTSVTMAAKSHLRNGRPVVIAVSTNDALGTAAENIGRLMARRTYYFVPFRQDDAASKPASMVADFTKLPGALAAAMEGKQLQPVLL